MADLLRNLHAGMALALAMRVGLPDFRCRAGQLVPLVAADALLVAGLRALTTPGVEAGAGRGPGPAILLAVGVAGSVYLVDTVRRARIPLVALLVAVMSAEATALAGGAAAWLALGGLPAAWTADGRALLPWVMLAWMSLIVLRAAAVLGARPGDDTR